LAFNFDLIEMAVHTTKQSPDTQGDQIGRIFAHWAIIYFGQFLEKSQK
jgi:hypothetical protein